MNAEQRRRPNESVGEWKERLWRDHSMLITLAPVETEEPENEQPTPEPSAPDGNEVLNAARAVHQALSSWTSLLFSALEKEKGTSREEALIRVSALQSRILQIQGRYAPAIVTLTCIYLLSHSMQRMVVYGRHFAIRDCALAREAVDRLGKCLCAVLQDEGWTPEQVTEQVASFGGKMAALVPDQDAIVMYLTLALSLDNYAKCLIAEAAKSAAPPSPVPMSTVDTPISDNSTRRE